ncbi:MAG: glutathione S-transferase [Rhizobiaceae bacterium]|nr:glutathione S-transferase [Rhizobiaceae bacterium]
MKLFDGGLAPNPRRVRVFLAEKGIDVVLEPVDMAGFGHKDEPVTARNPFQRLPVLELDDGRCLTESVAICRYFEELHPEPPLFGISAFERAKVEEWNRRLELYLLAAVAAAFRHLHPAMKEWEVPQVAEWGEANKPKALSFLAIFDAHLADHRYAAGDGYSIADITGMIGIDFMKPARIVLPEGLSNVRRWYGEVSARPSAKA